MLVDSRDRGGRGTGKRHAFCDGRFARSGAACERERASARRLIRRPARLPTASNSLVLVECSRLCEVARLKIAIEHKLSRHFKRRSPQFGAV